MKYSTQLTLPCRTFFYLQVGSLSVAVKYECSDSGCGGIAVASLRKPESPLIVELLGTRKIAKVTDGVVVLHSGLAADSRCV